MADVADFLEQHGYMQSILKEEIHKNLQTAPHFDILFADAMIGDIRFRDLFFESVTAFGGRLSKWKFNNRPHKLLNLSIYLQAVLQAGVAGAWAECGVYKGLSSYFLCRTVQSMQADYAGEHFHMFDSFEGLSAPTEEDLIVIINPEDGQFQSSYSDSTFEGPFEEVKRNVATRFPNVGMHKGWIPEVFDQVSDQAWAFVHIDVDQYQPTYDSLVYFYPRLSSGGIIITDDYGAPGYPGASKAWNQYCGEQCIHFAILDSGQAVLVKE